MEGEKPWWVEEDCVMQTDSQSDSYALEAETLTENDFAYLCLYFVTLSSL